MTHKYYLQKKRVVVIDHNQHSVSAYKLIFDNSEVYEIVACYEKPSEAIKKLLKDQPEIILMEVGSSFENLVMIQKIKSLNNLIHIIVLTNNDHSSHIIDAVSFGASGYLLKHTALPNLPSHIDAVLNGGAVLSPTAAKILVDLFKRRTTSLLSKRELEVIMMIATGNSYTEIGQKLEISSETAKTHIRNIYKKLNVNSKSAAIDKAVGAGLLTII